MKKLLFLSLAAAALASCNNGGEGTASSTDSSSKDSLAKDTTQSSAMNNTPAANMMNFVTYPKDTAGKKPAVLVIPEWWGLNEYPKMRAQQLSDLGYVAMAVDMYGDGRIAADPTQAQNYATPFYKDPTLTKTRIDMALAQLKADPRVDTSKIAAIGYCYGGFCVLNAAKLGADLKAVVSFHGDLSGVAPDKSLEKAKILVCHGEADKFVSPESVANFKKQMDSAGIKYNFISYPNATHAFTNPMATETGKKFNMPIEYNEAADKKSWSDMKAFLAGALK